MLFRSSLARWLGSGGADGPQHGLELIVPAPAAGLQLLLEGPGLEALVLSLRVPLCRHF